MSKKTTAIAASILSLTALTLSACGSIEPMSLTNAYGVQVPDPSDFGGEVIYEGEANNVIQGSQTTRYGYVIGYKDLSFEDLQSWLEENAGSNLSGGLALRSTNPEAPVDLPYQNVSYKGEKSFCFATARDGNMMASDGVTVTPTYTDADADYPVIVDVTVSKNSLGCPDSEYFSDVKPLLEQQGSDRGSSVGDLVGGFIDGLLG